MADEHRNPEGGLRPWEELTIADDFMFGRVMGRADLCAMTISTILGVEIGRVEYAETQHSVELRPDAKGVRFDAYVRDGAGTVYDVEMQTAGSPLAIARRARYYQAMCALGQLGPGEEYNGLRDCFVIFLCTFDPVGADRRVYTFRSRCEEEPAILLPDGATTVLLSTTGTRGAVSEELAGLLEYVGGGVPRGRTATALHDEVLRARANKEWRQVYMTFDELVRRETKAACERGIAQGLAEGLAEGRAEGRATGLAEGRAEGEGLLASLMAALLSKGRSDDAARAAADPTYRRELYAEYGLA